MIMTIIKLYNEPLINFKLQQLCMVMLIVCVCYLWFAKVFHGQIIDSFLKEKSTLGVRGNPKEQ